jgi:hypothetical protein
MGARAGLVIALIAAAMPGAGLAAPRVSGELGYGYDSNANRARRGGSERESQQARGALALDSAWRLSDTLAVLLQGSFEGQHDFEFDGLTNGKLTGLARLFYRANGRFYTPAFTLTGAAAHWDFNSRQRDSAEYRASTHLSERITTRISARLGFSAVWCEARGAVFDLQARSGLLDFDWNLQPRLTLYFGYQYREGDLVATATTPAAPAGVKAYEPDDAFGIAGDLAYRIAADAQIGTLGFNYALSPTLALDVQGQFVEAEADLGTHYERWLSTAGLLFRF